MIIISFLLCFINITRANESGSGSLKVLQSHNLPTNIFITVLGISVYSF